MILINGTKYANETAIVRKGLGGIHAISIMLAPRGTRLIVETAADPAEATHIRDTLVGAREGQAFEYLDGRLAVCGKKGAPATPILDTMKGRRPAAGVANA
jgi:hypothetical protein